LSRVAPTAFRPRPVLWWAFDPSLAAGLRRRPQSTHPDPRAQCVLFESVNVLRPSGDALVAPFLLRSLQAAAAERRSPLRGRYCTPHHTKHTTADTPVCKHQTLLDSSSRWAVATSGSLMVQAHWQQDAAAPSGFRRTTRECVNTTCIFDTTP